MRRYFNKSPHGYFIIIGDEGVILLCVKGKKLRDRKFISNDLEEEQIKEAFTEFTKKYKRIPIYIFLDHSDSAFLVHSVPDVGLFNADGIAKRHLRREYKEFQIRHYNYISKGQNKHCNFLFSAAQVTDKIKLYTDLAINANNPFLGYCLSPLEFECVSRVVIRKTYKPKEQKKLYILIYSTKVGGFRHIVMYKGKMIFSRLIAVPTEEDKNLIVSGMYNDIQSSMQYLDRIEGLEKIEKEDIGIIFAGSESYKEAIEQSEFAADISKILLPFEIATFFSKKDIIKQEDKFSDMLGIYPIIFRGVNQILQQGKTTIINKMYAVNNRISLGWKMISLLGVLGYILITGEVQKSEKYNKELEMHRANLEQKRDRIEKIINLKTKEINKISDATEVHEYMIERQKISFVNYLDNLFRAKGGMLSIRSISVKTLNHKDKNTKSKVSALFNKYKEFNNFKYKKKTDIVHMLISATISSKDNLSFTVRDNILKQFKNNFTGYHVFMSQIPQTIRLDGSNTDIPITIEIVGTLGG